MSLLSVQQKLQLEQQLKMQQQENRMQMKRRENLVYGLKAADYQDDMIVETEANTKNTEKQEFSKKGFVFRCLIALLLFVIVCIMKYDGVTIYGVDYQMIIDSLGNTDFINGIDFSDYITYTDI